MNNHERKVILFGAGVYAKKYKALLEYLNMDFDYFTDNDSAKWGTTLYGKAVIAPNQLCNFEECRIIISSTHEIAIRQQLTEMGLQDRILEMETLYEMCVARVINNAGKIPINSEETIIVDMYEGIGWGGTELWAANLACGLHKAGRLTYLIGGKEQPELDAVYEELVVRISEKETIMQMVELFEKNLPFIFVNNFAGCAFMAAIVVKKKYPDLVKIISVIHNDNKSLFDAHMMLQDNIDKVFCVSNQIRNEMQLLYALPEEKYYFKEQPIEAEDSWWREANLYGTLNIGYAARLVKQQKRADLLIDLIEALERCHFDYIFEIAGEGECSLIIADYIEKNQLEHRVHLLGRIPKSEMGEFWKRQDVFVNVSEYEGTSLSMLEAMSYGCVPVVTDVSGTREFIKAGENGYICEVGDIEGIAQSIFELAKDRERLKCYGEGCRSIVKERCNPKDYIEYWMKDLLIKGNIKNEG